MFFATAELCQFHERTYHNITVKTKKGHMCKYCNKVMSTAYNLRCHVQIKHTKISKLMCPKCRQPFTHRQRYEKHILHCV